MREPEALIAGETPSPPSRPVARRGACLTLADRLDEAAKPLHDVGLVKAGLIVVGGLSAALILPWTYCLAWVAGGLAIELWTWFATRDWPPAGAVITPARRRNFACAYVAMNLSWLVLGGLFWAAGTPESQAAAVAMFLIIAAVAVLLYYNVPAVFLASGLAPAVGALVMLSINPGQDPGQMAAVWIVLALGVVFTLGRAIDTPSLQESQRRINDTLQKYEDLTANITDMIARTSLSGEFRYVSPAVFAILGYRPEELVGTLRWNLVDAETDEEMLASALQRMLENPDRPEVITGRMRHKDGSWVWLQSSARLIFEDGEPVGFVDVCRDVTAQVAAEAALQAAKAEAESATRAKADFLANVSHEIRTPMNGILGALHLLDREAISPEGRELMRRANDCGKMLSQLLNDVLDFSKIEAGQLDLAPEPMDLREALESVVGLLDDQARAKGVELRCEIPAGDLWIEADPVRLRQAMFNLLGNAVKFTNEGHVTIRLGVIEVGRMRRVRLEIEDTGIGMTPEAQSRLFERFHQAESDTARRFGGAGLGLSITQALAHMMGGDIGFTSAAGYGSTFWFLLEAPAAVAPAAETVEAGLLEGISILLVEDNPTNRLVARTMLTRLGARVDEAEDGVVGVASARAGVHDLILMDIQMPHMGGVEATRAIRGLAGPASRTPILALTANAMVHQREEYLAAGMNGVVSKPISAANLLAEISRLMTEEDARMAG